MTAPTQVSSEAIDKDLRYLWVNPLMADINGRTVEAQLGSSVDEVLPASRRRWHDSGVLRSNDRSSSMSSK